MTFNKTPNGCTWLPKQPPQVEDCCLEHDLAYINRTGKLRADFKFFLCLMRKGYWFRAILFTLAVIVFGYYFYYYREINKLWKIILRSEK